MFFVQEKMLILEKDRKKLVTLEDTVPFSPGFHHHDGRLESGKQRAGGRKAGGRAGCHVCLAGRAIPLCLLGPLLCRPPCSPSAHPCSPSVLKDQREEASPHEKGGGSRDFPEPRLASQTAHGEQGLEAPGGPHEAFYFVRTTLYP